MTNMQQMLSKRILIVDDSRLQRLHIREILTDIGYSSIQEAEDGLAALNIITNEDNIDIIILDLEMPKMDGIQVIGKLSALEKKYPIIVSSALDTSLLSAIEKIGDNINAPLLGVMKKPFEKLDFISCLSRYDAVMKKIETKLHQNQYSFSDDDIKKAIEQQEFVAFFQPKISLIDGELSSVESLIRWNHPEHGMLAPFHFIDLVEKGPHIHDITTMMLDITTRQLTKWQQQGIDIAASINVSARSLFNPEFTDNLINKTIASGISTEKIIIEITESAIMSDLASSLGSLARLRLNGFYLSIDDYGTGFSSMLQLSRIPFTELKIDRAFVNGASQNAKLRILLESAIDIAKKLNLTTVAEGVETLEDYILLKTLKCDYIQGYYVAKPMPGDALSAWWRSNQQRFNSV